MKVLLKSYQNREQSIVVSDLQCALQALQTCQLILRWFSAKERPNLGIEVHALTTAAKTFAASLRHRFSSARFPIGNSSPAFAMLRRFE